MIRNLLISGGPYHPFNETSASIAAHLNDLGIVSQLCGVAEGFDRLTQEDFDLVTINALGFSMTQADKYGPLRDRFAHVCSEQNKTALQSHVARNGGLLGLHTAAVCFDTWAEWGDLLGISWVWGQSHHPQPGYFDVIDETGRFQIWDELYSDMQVAPDATVLATAQDPEGGKAQPVMTAKDRCIYLALGHDLTATENPGYVRLLKEAAARALGNKG